MIKAIIFDMDGVLIDSQPMHFEIDAETLHKCGIKVGLKEVQSYAGMANNDRWTKYKKDFNIEKQIEELIEIHTNTLFDRFKNSDLGAINGIPELLEKIKTKNLKMAVASSSPHEFIMTVLEKLEIKHYFDKIISAESCEKSKPDPEVFLKTAELLGCTPEECIVIEDSHHGVKAAVNAKMKCVGYINKNSGKQDLSSADIIIDDFNKIPEDLF